jgi:hypothetical protein
MKNLFGMARRLVLSFLLAYWAIFLGYTVWNFAHGGMDRVISWYAHIQNEGTLAPWRPSRFLVDNLIVLCLTLALLIRDRRARRQDC